ncbi:hypothetical protein KAU08_09840 [bacterium]|nr:hypothetical protein [bacterium]
MAQQIKYDSPSLTRFVYDGSQLVQEILFDVEEVETDWVYTYNDLTRDYLRQPGGIRQRERSGGNDTDYFMTANAGTLEFKTERDPVAETYARNEHTSSMDQLPSSTFADISNLMTSNGYIEMYGGTTAGDTAGFDPLVQMGGRHYLGGLGIEVNAYAVGGRIFVIPVPSTPSCTYDCPKNKKSSGDWMDNLVFHMNILAAARGCMRVGLCPYIEPTVEDVDLILHISPNVCCYDWDYVRRLMFAGAITPCNYFTNMTVMCCECIMDSLFDQHDVHCRTIAWFQCP